MAPWCSLYPRRLPLRSFLSPIVRPFLPLTMSVVAITGATGFLGSHIVSHLLDRSLLPASRIIATCRDPKKAAPLAARGVSVRQAAFDDLPAMASALKGADSVLIISPNDLEKGTALTANAIEGAKAAGVKKIYYTSHTGAKEHSRFPPGVSHWHAEQGLAESGLEWTSLRNGFYLSSTDHMYGKPLEYGSITAPPDGKVSWVDRGDLAEAIAVILAGKYDTMGINYLDLVNSTSWDMADAARILSRVTGKDIKRVEVDEKTQVEILKAAGVPDGMAGFFTGTVECMKDGDFAKTDGVLEGILGRKCRTLEEYLQEKYGN